MKPECGGFEVTQQPEIHNAISSALVRPSPFSFKAGMWLFAVLLALAIVVATAVGAVHISFTATASMLLNATHLTRFATNWSDTDAAIVFQIRLPRVLAAALIGAALSVAGTLFQGLLRNPMADSYVIGASGGAALGATLGLLVTAHVSVLGFGAVSTLAFLGAFAAMLLVYRLSLVGGRTPIVTLLLAGFVVSVILGYVMSFLLIANDSLQLNTRLLHVWLLGGVSIARWSQVAVIALLVVVGCLLSLTLGKTLNGLSLGDEMAQHLGIAVERKKAVVIVLGSLLTAAAVSGGGLIGFVGLIVPHFLRILFGPDHRRLLPLAAIAGASFLVTADLFARTLLAPTELPVGIITAFTGGPVFLLLLSRTKKEYRF